MPRRSRPRPYRKRARARQEEATRRRITEAAVELHGTVGPVRTSITDVARLAGVSRMTVYNHFPTEADLFRACSSHWAAHHPPPDPASWAILTDPAARLRRGLDDLYRWYEENQGMLGNVLRDVTAVPAMQPVVEQQLSSYVDRVVETLAAGWAVEPAERAPLRAMLRLIVDFWSWRSLSSSGLGSGRAALRGARLVVGAVGRGGAA